MRQRSPFRRALAALVVFALPALAQMPARPATPVSPAPAPAPAPAVSPTQVAATVNGEPIYEVIVQRSLAHITADKRAAARGEVLDKLIDTLLIDQSLRAAKITVSKAEVDKHLADMKANLKKMGSDFDKMLAQFNVKESEVRERLEGDLRWDKYANMYATDKALQDLLTSSKDLFDGSAVRAKHILLPVGSNEQAVVAQLRDMKKTIEAEVTAALAKMPATSDKVKARNQLMADTFSKYAREKSTCKQTKAQGGEVGWFPKVGYLPPAFTQPAFLLQPGQISDAVKTPMGYHLILVTERRAGRPVKFAEVKDLVKAVYVDRLQDSLAAQLRTKSKIVIAPVK